MPENLRDARQSRPDPVALTITGNVDEISMDEYRPLRSGPHEGHVTVENVPDLGQFVEGGLAQKPADPESPWIIDGGQNRARLTLRRLHHSPELQLSERPTTTAHHDLRNENRPRIFKPDEKAHHRPQPE